MAKCVVIESGGRAYLQDLSQLEEYQQIVGGDIEGVNFGDELTALCNENGKLDRLPPNHVATHWGNLRNIGWLPGDYFCGNVIIVGPVDDVTGDFSDLPEEVSKQLLAGPSEPRAHGRLLTWQQKESWQEAELKNPDGTAGVVFQLTYHPTCYRRGPYRLRISVSNGPYHLAWGCFDEQDQPLRYYHDPGCALGEAEAIAKVLVVDFHRQAPKET